VPEISKVSAMEILDSRGNPTIAVTVILGSGISAQAKIPSGASTGSREAIELRDNEPGRYAGKGVLRACENAEGKIQELVCGMDAADQTSVDEAMIRLDGTPNKAHLGANAILGVSLAVARAAAAEARVPLYRHLAGNGECLLPTPMLNILNGGRHANNSVDFQEFMIAPVGASSFAEGLRAAAEIYHALRADLHNRGLSTSVGDEGGFAPELRSNEEAIELLLRAIEHAGYEPGSDIAIMLDPAASELYEGGAYHFRKSKGGERSSTEMVTLWRKWKQQYPAIWSLEDGMAEQDHEGWQEVTKELGSIMQVVGDDNFVTNIDIFRQGITDGIANAILIKLNQIGTLTETLRCMDLARQSGYGTVISHRSGETDDTTIADLAVGTAAGQIKTGAPNRGERVAKYNRLLEIEKELGTEARYAGMRPYQRWIQTATP
jgi:enolase